MGNKNSTDGNVLQDERNLYAKVVRYRTEKSRGFSSSYIVYEFCIRHKRWKWTIVKRYGEMKSLHKLLIKNHQDIADLQEITFPSAGYRLFGKMKDRDLQVRGDHLAIYIQALADIPGIFNSQFFKVFLEVGKTSLIPTLGRKGKAGYLKKCSGGYLVKGLSGGDGVFKNWRWRWIAAHDSCIAYHIDELTAEPEGVMMIDSGFRVWAVGRYIHMTTKTRRLTMYAPTERIAREWTSDLQAFYNACPRSKVQHFNSSFPPRHDVDDVHAFTCSRDYYYAVAVEMLKAQEDIFISAWKLSPAVILTRPPLPPIRLEQILKYKANQGVKIYILLYKEVEMSRQGNNSLRAKKYLEGISPNIKCIRHPNKFFGSTTAILWSHHEKLVIVDRCTAFVGGLDMALNRYDDFEHSIVDEDGVRFPGADYRQHATGLHRPVRSLRKTASQVESRMGHEVILSAEAVPSAHFAHEVAYDNYPMSVDQDDITVIGACDDSMVRSSTRLVEHDSMTESRVYAHTNTEEGAAEEGYGLPETDEEQRARESAGFFVEAVPCNELDVLETVPTQEPSGFLNSLFGVFESLGGALEDALGAVSTRGPPEGDLTNVRDQYPRQAWHDVHAMVKGTPARDIGFHFVQRWNFHRMSKNEMSKEFLIDITDNPLFSECARCELVAIPERATECPRCHLLLGPCGKYAIPPTVSTSSNPFDFASPYGSARLPDPPASFSFIVFECNFVDKIGCTLYGFGPVCVENVLEVPVILSPGTLIRSQGEYADCLEQRGLLPSIGDIMLSVDGVGVGHLSYTEVKRFVGRKFAALSHGQLLSVSFRRHYSQGAVNAYNNSLGINYESQPASREVGDPMRSSHSLLTARSAVAQPMPLDCPLPSTVKTDPDAASSIQDTNTHHILSASGAVGAIHYDETEVNAPPLESISYGGYYPALPVVEPYAGSIRAPFDADENIPNLVEDDDDEGYQVISQIRAPNVPMPSIAVPAASVTEVGTQEHVVVSSRDLAPSPTDTARVASLEEIMAEATVPGTSDEATAGYSSCGVDIPVSPIAEINAVPAPTPPPPPPRAPPSPVRPVDAGSSPVRELLLPDAPNSLPDILFPQAPSAAVHRRVEQQQHENREVAEGFVAMSGYHDIRSTPPLDTDDSLMLQAELPQAPAVHTEQSVQIIRGVEEHVSDDREVVEGHVAMSGRGDEYKTSPQDQNQPQPSYFTSELVGNSPGSYSVTAPSVGARRSEAYAIPISSNTLYSEETRNRQVPRRSSLYLSDGAFPTDKREYTCKETIDIETRFSASLITYENFEFADGGFMPLPAQSSGSCEVHVLRSCGPWSVGSTVEHSIQNAWVEAIANSKHFVYIENQFFIGSTETDGSHQIQNRILASLLLRLTRAVKNQEHFRVIVVVPLHPSGDYLNEESPRIILNYEFLSICRGGRSLVESLVRECPGVDPSQYIGFYSLKNWGVMNEKIVTEQIYVHDKVLIVDDVVAIIGSANLNDRSMLGDRDSEMAIRVVDTAIVNITLGGQPWQAGFFPHMLRMNLMRAHSADQDPYSGNLVDMAYHGQGNDPYSLHWRYLATCNSDIYNELEGETSMYRCQTLPELRNALQRHIHRSFHDDAVRDMVHRIRGHLVHWPLDFLCRENLAPNMTTKAFVPLDLWL